MATTTRTVDIPEQLDSVKVLGVYDEVIREIEREYKEITVHVRGNRITITSTSRQGEREASQAQELIRALIDAAYTSPLDAATVRRMLEQQVLHNDVRDEVPGHGPTVQKLRRFKEHERDRLSPFIASRVCQGPSPMPPGIRCGRRPPVRSPM